MKIIGWGSWWEGITTITTTTLLGFSTFALPLLRDVEKETHKHKVLWEKCWEAKSEGCNIENVVVYLKSVQRLKTKNYLVVEEYVEEILVVEEDDTGILVYLKSVCGGR